MEYQTVKQYNSSLYLWQQFWQVCWCYQQETHYSLEWWGYKPRGCQEIYRIVHSLFKCIPLTETIFQFKTDIHAILSSPGKPSIVLFSNGYTESLEASMDKRKEEKPNLLCPGDVICKAYLENIKNQSIIVICSKNRVLWIAFILKHTLIHSS